MLAQIWDKLILETKSGRTVMSGMDLIYSVVDKIIEAVLWILVVIFLLGLACFLLFVVWPLLWLLGFSVDEYGAFRQAREPLTPRNIINKVRGKIKQVEAWAKEEGLDEFPGNINYPPLL